MKFLTLIFLLLGLTSCQYISRHIDGRLDGEWATILGNGEEVEWLAPFAIRNNACADYTYKENYYKANDEEITFLCPREIAEKMDLYGRKNIVIRYLNGKKDVFTFCSEKDVQLSYTNYLKSKYEKVK